MKKFEELLNAYRTIVLGLGTCPGTELGELAHREQAARLALVEFVRELIEPKPRDPCVGASRDTGAW